MTVQVCVHISYSCLINLSNVVLDRLYSDKHEWITVDGNIGTIGASNYAQVIANTLCFQ